jgi:uncharacterized protein (DUF362 family)
MGETVPEGLMTARVGEVRECLDPVCFLSIIEKTSLGGEGMVDVSLLRCTEYSTERLKGLMLEAFGHVRFSPDAFRSARVVLKPNLLSAVGPDSGIVTHPAFFQAAAELVLDHGGRPVLAESPAVASLENALAASGYAGVVGRLGIEVADPALTARITFDQAVKMRSFEVARAFVEADVILNLPKFKTHNLTYVTASVKNLFGAVPGMRKSALHLQCPEPGDFSEAILDLYGAFLHGSGRGRTLVHLMDAVVALEGNGPGSGGKPRALNAVVTGLDGLAVDWVATRVSGLDPLLCPILVSGFARGLGVSSGDEVRVVGEDLDRMRVKGFAPPGGFSMAGILRIAPVGKALKRLFTGRPVPRAGLCTLCLQCRDICPAQAIGGAGTGRTVPVVDYGRCIRCWCCM